MVREANAIDFWRGFALVSIFINHIPGIYFERFTHKNFSISDSAELFVFLAGWALFITVDRCGNRQPTQRVLYRLGSRVVGIYAAQILISSIAIAMLAIAARVLENPLFLEWHNAAAVFYDPIPAQIGLVTLTHQLGYFDILPLYVVLMLFSPIIILMYRYAGRFLFPVSLTIYLLAIVFQISIPSWPTERGWFFNPFTWQFVFVLGFVLARAECGNGILKPYMNWLRVLAVPIVVVSAYITLIEWRPDPILMPEPTFLFIDSKAYASPMRMIQFLALVVLFSNTFPYIKRSLPWFSQFLSKLGRNSLNVFCVSSLLSLLAQILRFYFEGALLIDTIIVVVGIAILWLTAWLSEWSKVSKHT